MNCANCNVPIPQSDVGNQDDHKKLLFYTVCNRCINTCSECGQDVGFSKSSRVSEYECSFCAHQSCRSCSINLSCNECGIIACESCIEDCNSGGCIHLVVKLNLLRRELSNVHSKNDAGTRKRPAKRTTKRS